MMTPMLNRNGSSGFTLLEVLIAMAIFALIGLASFSIFSAITDGDTASKARIKNLNDIQRTLLIMERDFIQLARRQARIEGDAPKKGYLHTTDGFFEEDVSNIAFTRLGWTNPG